MEKEFIPYELAIKLKELGFDENCLAYFKDDEFKIPNPHEPFRNSEMKAWFVSAPLYQQGFDWFREKYGFICEPKKYIDWYFDIEIIVNGKAETDWVENTATFENYEEARQSCLEKLIELASK